MKKPNILYIHSHDTGRYIEPHGYGVPTPAFMRLAREGVMFRHHHAVAPTCSPSRAALLTGQYPHQCGMLGLAHLGYQIDDYGKVWCNLFREEGYHTALCGTQGIADFNQSVEAAGRQIGYEETLDVPLSNNVEEVAPAAVSWLLQHKQDTRPFFLDVGFNATHRGERDYHRMDAFDETNPNRRPPEVIPDTLEFRRDAAKFAASVQSLDWGLGEILEALDQTGLADNTIIVATTDHGAPWPNMKSTLTTYGTGIFLIIRGPRDTSYCKGACFSGGQVIESLCSNLDVLPTLCDCLDIPTPDRCEGTSLTPCLQDAEHNLHEALFSEINWHVEHEPTRSIRTSEWVYIERFSPVDSLVVRNLDGGPLIPTFVGHPHLDPRHFAAEQLYNTFWDPQECNNRADELALADIKLELRERLHRWMLETNDPLCELFLPPDEAGDQDHSGR